VPCLLVHPTLRGPTYWQYVSLVRGSKNKPAEILDGSSKVISISEIPLHSRGLSHELKKHRILICAAFWFIEDINNDQMKEN
jgi:hypothetical protein